MAARSSNIGNLTLASVAWVLALAAIAASLAPFFHLAPEVATRISHVRNLLLFLSGAPAVIVVSVFGYRLRVSHFLKNRSGYLFSPITAWCWMSAAALLPSIPDAREGQLQQLWGFIGMLLFVLLGWSARGPKVTPTLNELAPEPTESEMTRLKLV